MGLHGPYALWFTTGGAPSGSISRTFIDYFDDALILTRELSDTQFWEGLSINGLVPLSGRGRITGKATGFPSGFSSLMSIGWSNSAAQYW